VVVFPNRRFFFAPLFSSFPPDPTQRSRAKFPPKYSKGPPYPLASSKDPPESFCSRTRTPPEAKIYLGTPFRPPCPPTALSRRLNNFTTTKKPPSALRFPETCAASPHKSSAPPARPQRIPTIDSPFFDYSTPPSPMFRELDLFFPFDQNDSPPLLTILSPTTSSFLIPSANIPFPYFPPSTS